MVPRRMATTSSSAEQAEQTIKAERFGTEAPWLDAYGATSISEFFAVACEAYFVNRPNFARDFPGVLAIFDEFFLPKQP